MAKGLTAGGTDSVGGQKASMAIEQSGRASLLNSIIGALLTFTVLFFAVVHSLQLTSR